MQRGTVYVSIDLNISGAVVEFGQTLTPNVERAFRGTRPGKGHTMRRFADPQTLTRDSQITNFSLAHRGPVPGRTPPSSVLDLERRHS